MLEWSVHARLSELPEVQGRIQGMLKAHDAPEKVLDSVSLAVKEAFTSIVLGTSTSLEVDEVTVGCWIVGKHREAFIRLANPGARRDPTKLDLLGDAASGTAGMYLLKKNVDQVKYEYIHGMNILTMRVQFSQ